MLQEAERTIFSPNNSVKSLNEIPSAYGDQACYVYLLLGDIYRYQQRFPDAARCYKECLNVNPLMWTAYESLCKIGEFVDVDEYFKVSGNLGLTTPTFTVVRQSVTTAKSPLSTNLKTEREKLVSRENVNPNSPLNDPAALNTVHNTDEEAESEKHATSINAAQILRTTYISHCSVPPADFSVNQSTLPDNTIEQFTPSGLSIPLQTPAAPLGNVGDALQKRPVNSEFSFGGGDACTPPTFGLLASIPHSPMFACVPVFSRQDTVPGLHESPQPLRLALHPASSNIRQDNRPSAPVSQAQGIGHLQSAILFNTTSSSVNPTGATISQLRSRGCKISTPVVNTPHLLLNVAGGLANNRNSTVSAVPLPPRWITGSPIPTPQADLVSGNTSTPSASGLALSAAFVLPKTLDLEDFVKIPSSGTAVGLDPKTGCALPETTPMDLSESFESSPSDMTIPENSSFAEPRTRAQKARAAAAAAAAAATTAPLTQRRSPRLNRAHKTCEVMTASTEDSVAKCTQTFHRIVSTTASPLPVTRLSFARAGESESKSQRATTDCPKLACSLVSGAVERSDPRSESLLAYLLLLRRLGLAFSLLSQHEYRSAMTALSELSHDQLATGLVLSWAARAHSDAADYPKARRLFNELRRLEPWQLRGMDLFSTVLWYLQDEIELSHLANDLLNLDRNAPEPWLAAGNCFSLQREHEVAVRFFRRALQVCPTDSYACTLLGHEYMSMDNLERAVSAFRHALRLDERNYKARFGLSNVYFKQEFFDLADAHLVRALTIFPQSCLLLTHLGAVRARMGRLSDAPGSSLDCLNKAVSIDPNNTLARYHRACALTSLGRYQEAISEFERLVLLCPREAMIYFRLDLLTSVPGSTSGRSDYISPPGRGG
nr:unnamed protein product [Spirometra erinaceieuropaei]